MNPGSDKLGFASSTRTDNILVDTAVARLEADTRTCAAVAHVRASIPNWFELEV